MTTKIYSEKESLVSFIEEVKSNYDLIVVCGYDNVGKVYVENIISNGKPIFHPNYSLICKNVNKEGRWSFFMYFLTILNTFKDSIIKDKPLLFDRSSLCGAVYNNDIDIAREYSKMIKDFKVLHILVTCEEESYLKFCSVRDSDIKESYDLYKIYTERYRNYLNIFNLAYIEYINKYDEDLGNKLSSTCGGCKHFKDGVCINRNVTDKSSISYKSKRCIYSKDKGVQDINVKTL